MRLIDDEIYLKPCPFCSSGVVTVESEYKPNGIFLKLFPWVHNGHRVRCKVCLASTAYCWTANIAVEQWNTRRRSKYIYGNEEN